MLEKKIIGIVGSGLIGTDPFDERSWSGSSRYFFNKLKEKGALQRAFGVEASKVKKLPLMLKNFSPDRELWRQKFYLDTSYYEELSREIASKITPEDEEFDFVQIGGIYNVPRLLKRKARCFSYHDGNLAQLLKSPYIPIGVSKKLINKALDYEKNVYSGMHKIFTMSEYLRKSFIDDFDVAEDKVVCIGGGINIDNIPEFASKNYDKKQILFIGIRFHRKGGEHVLKAFRAVRSRYPDAILNIVGPKKLEIPGHLSEGVIYHGFLSRNDPEGKRKFERLLRDSVLFVMPSLYEPFGIAPLEAMVHQIPCILTNNWAFPEMVTPGVNGELINCGDVEDLIDKMLALLENPDLLQEMGDLARKRVLNKYTWETVAKRFVEEISQ